MPKTTAYTALDAPYHYAGGVIAPGQSVELSDDEAARGLASGAIVPTPAPERKAEPLAESTEETP